LVIITGPLLHCRGELLSKCNTLFFLGLKNPQKFQEMIFSLSKVLVLSQLLVAFHVYGQTKVLSPYQIKVVGKDGAWLWFNNESVIIDKNIIYIGSEDSKGISQVYSYPVGDRKENIPIGEYDLSSWNENERKYPSHNYPSLLKLNNGNLLAAYHNSSRNMFYRIAEVINSETVKGKLMWEKETVLELNNGMNYSNLIQLRNEHNKIYNFFSIYKQSPSVMISENGGRSWNSDSIFMVAGNSGTSPYLKFADNGKDRIDILYTNGHPRKEPNNSIYHMYLYKGNFHKSDGKMICSMKRALKEPLSPESGTLIYDGGTSGPGWVWDIEYDRHNIPVSAFISSADGAEGNDLRYHYAKWDLKSRQWIESQIAYAGTHIYVPENHFAGGICIDPENVNVVFLSSNVNPETGKPSDASRYQIYRGITGDNGKSWLWEQLTFDKERDNLRPIVPRNHHYKICVIWYSLAMNVTSGFKADILGIIEK
jgi:hypothetical protein